MELREFLLIFQRRLNLFLAVVLLFLALGTLIKMMEREEYESQLTLNVSRKGVEDTRDYRFDGFYRLQADEKFAETVVRWLATPRLMEDLRQQAFPEKGTGPEFKLEARRLSSQMIDIRILSGKAGDADTLARAVDEVINRQAEKLDRRQQEKSWFWVVSDDPVTRRKVLSWDRAIFFALLSGIFAAFWTVLLSHYLSEKTDEDRN